MNIAKKLKTLLPEKTLRLLGDVEEAARHNGAAAYLVGGLVRDIFLGRRNFDLDVVIEGDAVEVVKSLVGKKGGTYIVHKKFGTATIVLKNGAKIDFATARKELYERPAALPTVEFSTVIEDLYRRDFTINAMAIDISKKNFGRLLDFFGGEKDLADKRIRVLHDASFIDDPTRIFRAVRFEQRFRFRIEPHTEHLIKEAVKKKMLYATGKERLRDELILIFKETDPARMLKRMDVLAGLEFIHPRLHFTKRNEILFDSVKETASWFKKAYPKKRALDLWLMYLMALLDGLNTREAAEVLSRFVFKKDEQAHLVSYKKDGPKTLRLLNNKGRLSPSRLYKCLEPLPYEVMLSIMAKGPSMRLKKRVSDFLTRYDGVTLKINGRDLKALGLSAGPRFKKILTATMDAKLDKGFKNKAQEIEFAKRYIRYGR